MGYTTEFSDPGFTITPPLSPELCAQMIAFNEVDHRDGDTPGIWCGWVPQDDGKSLGWDGGEKFYEYEAWLGYLIEKFLSPSGHVLSGEVSWQGEDPDDQGMIRVVDNVITIGEVDISFRFPDDPEDPFRAFVRGVAELMLEGEGEDEDGECEGFVWENDAAWSTLQELIGSARELIG